MREPIKFNILATKWTLEFKEKLSFDHGVWGLCFKDTKRIEIQEPTEGVRFPLHQVTTTVLHEMLHAILDELNYKELCDDEDFIVRVSAAMSQALQSGKLFDKKRLEKKLSEK